ncbi:hypothetical protein ACFOHK_15540 [Falsigemmobacter intermedius]|uniref:hypothetical protein n=1 Tax=Falsigemmobacter intermedius TaxID=1553448 RepID=UPI003608A382
MTKAEIIAAAAEILSKLTDDHARADALLEAYNAIEPRSIRGDKASRFKGADLGFGPIIARRLRAAGRGEMIFTRSGINSAVNFHPIEVLLHIIKGCR